MTPVHVTLPDIQVMYVESTNGSAGGPKAFATLEAPSPIVQDRTFYETFQPPAGPYRACVAIEPNDDVTALGFPTWTNPPR